MKLHNTKQQASVIMHQRMQTTPWKYFANCREQGEMMQLTSLSIAVLISFILELILGEKYTRYCNNKILYISQ